MLLCSLGYQAWWVEGAGKWVVGSGGRCSSSWGWGALWSGHFTLLWSSPWTLLLANFLKILTPQKLHWLFVLWIKFRLFSQASKLFMIWLNLLFPSSHISSFKLFALPSRTCHFVHVPCTSLLPPTCTDSTASCLRIS